MRSIFGSSFHHVGSIVIANLEPFWQLIRPKCNNYSGMGTLVRCDNVVIGLFSSWPPLGLFWARLCEVLNSMEVSGDYFGSISQPFWGVAASNSHAGARQLFTSQNCAGKNL